MSLHATLSPSSLMNIGPEAAARGRAITNSRILTCNRCGLSTSPGPMALHTCDASYTAVHFRVVRRRGSARTHECLDCGAQAFDWSYNYQDPDEVVDGQRYSLHLENYDPRCRACHIRHDHEKDPALLEAKIAAAKAVPSEIRRRAGLASVGTPAGDRQRRERAIAGGRTTAKRRGR